jgi:hypothetical protein
MNQPSTQPHIYQLRMVLRGISPLIWRRVLMRSETTLAHLHAMLQILFTWSDEHLHSFHIHGREYGSSGANASHVRLSDLRLHRGERFRYVYDFGAHWECDIRLEAILPLAPRRVYPVCMGGVKDSRKGATHDARKIPTLGYDISEGSGFFSSPAFCFSRSRYDSPLILITTL